MKIVVLDGYTLNPAAIHHRQTALSFHHRFPHNRPLPQKAGMALHISFHRGNCRCLRHSRIPPVSFLQIPRKRIKYV